MLHSIRQLRGFKIQAADGRIGDVRDFYFDDRDWAVRYLVVDTGGWLSGREVLLSPVSLGRPDEDQKTFPVSLTRRQVEESPPSSADKPVSRQHEAELAAYYGWPSYWTPPPMFGPAAPVIPPPGVEPEKQLPQERGDPNLRSAREVAGYSVEGAGGEVGHIHDFLVDDEGWAIRYLVVDTSSWFGGKKVLLSQTWIREVSWAERRVTVGLPREHIKAAPAYDADSPATREYEARLWEHYQKPGYWQ
jgi:hypothetical protein